MRTRTILSTVTFFFTFSLLSPNLLCAQEIGLQLYSLRNQFKTDVPGTLAKIKSWNITEIEGGGTYGLPIDDYKKLLAQNNLKMVSVGLTLINWQKIRRLRSMRQRLSVQSILLAFGYLTKAMILQWMILKKLLKFLIPPES
jgi:hypothetical protein